MADEGKMLIGYRVRLLEKGNRTMQYKKKCPNDTKRNIMTVNRTSLDDVKTK